MKWALALEFATRIQSERPDLHTRIIGAGTHRYIAVSKKDQYRAPGYYSGRLGRPHLVFTEDDWLQLRAKV